MITEELDSVMTINLNDMAKCNGVVDSDACFGYTIVGDVLAPHSFMRRLELHFRSIELEYGAALSIRKLCGETFLNTLTDEERHVLAPCILLLINEAKITMHFPGEEQGDSIKPAGGYGRGLIDECDMPEALYNLLNKSLGNAWFERDRELSPRKALGDEIWNSLKKDDQDILGRCSVAKRSDDYVHLYPLDLPS